MKAKPVFKMYGKYSTIIEYEYRGYKYEVEYSNAMTYCITKPWVQHSIAQEKIDKMIEQKENSKNIKTENAEAGLDLFFQELG